MFICVYMYVYVCICMCIYMYLCIHVCMCMSVSIYIYIYIYIYNVYMFIYEYDFNMHLRKLRSDFHVISFKSFLKCLGFSFWLPDFLASQNSNYNWKYVKLLYIIHVSYLRLHQRQTSSFHFLLALFHFLK